MPPIKPRPVVAVEQTTTRFSPNRWARPTVAALCSVLTTNSTVLGQARLLHGLLWPVLFGVLGEDRLGAGLHGSGTAGLRRGNLQQQRGMGI